MARSKRCCAAGLHDGAFPPGHPERWSAPVTHRCPIDVLNDGFHLRYRSEAHSPRHWRSLFGHPAVSTPFTKRDETAGTTAFCKGVQLDATGDGGRRFPTK